MSFQNIARVNKYRPGMADPELFLLNVPGYKIGKVEPSIPDRHSRVVNAAEQSIYFMLFFLFFISPFSPQTKGVSCHVNGIVYAET